MTRPIESDYTSQVAYTRALEAYCDSLPQLEQPGQPEPVELLKLVIEEAEITWLAAEASIAVALLAAEKAYKTCLDVRCHWKREEGTDMCELAVLAIAISQAARSRANEVAHRNTYDPAEIKRGLAAFQAIEAKLKEKNT